MLSGWACRQVLASEKFAKIVDVLRQKTKSDQLVRAVRLCCEPQARRRLQRRRGDADRRAQFVYLKESFSPSLDEKLSVLYEARAAPPRR